jgi:protein-S-isoprenylcysteine O-methyltransferase Ste14
MAVIARPLDANVRWPEMTLFLKNLLFTLVVPATFAVYFPLLIAQDRSASLGVGFVAGCLALAVGMGIYAWCVWDFATFGRGTPAPIDAPKKLVVRGLYAYTRNPIYVGVLTGILGWALLFWAKELVLYALAVGIFFHLLVLLHEEPALESQFGESYRAYRRAVPRWGFTTRPFQESTGSTA